MANYSAQSTERFKLMYDISLTPVIIADESFKITYLNAVAENQFSVSVGDDMGLVTSNLTYERIKERIKSGITRFSFLGSRESSAMLADFSLALSSENEECIVCKIIEYPSEFTASLTRFVLSHDFRTPISIISSTADLLRKSPNLSEKEQVFSQIILNNCHRLLRILKNVSYSIRQEHVDDAGEPPAADLTALMGSIMLEAPVTAERNGVTVTCDEIPPHLVVACDYSRLECALLNLLSNAIKYGGKQVHFSVRQVADMVEISVKDDGAGISPRHIDRIFDPFFSIGNDPPVGAMGNMGLGLYIVKTLASDSGGSIKVNSSPGRGSEFVLTVPVFHGEGRLKSHSAEYGADLYSPVMLELSMVFSSERPQ